MQPCSSVVLLSNINSCWFLSCEEWTQAAFHCNLHALDDQARKMGPGCAVLWFSLWRGLERRERREQGVFWKAFLKENNEQSRQENYPNPCGLKKDSLGFHEYPFKMVIKNLNNNLNIILNTDTLSEYFLFSQRGRESKWQYSMLFAVWSPGHCGWIPGSATY